MKSLMLKCYRGEMERVDVWEKYYGVRGYLDVWDAVYRTIHPIKVAVKGDGK